MSEKKFKIGDKVRYVGDRTKELRGEVGVINGILGPSVSLADVIFDNGQSFLNIPFTSLEKIKDKKNSPHKTIKIVVRREGAGYRVKEVDALSENNPKLHGEYFLGYPRVYLTNKQLAICSRTASVGAKYYDSQGHYKRYISKGDFLFQHEAKAIKFLCEQAAKRLREINKRKRETEKTETWEW
jgi:hypothetical protein